jgi:transposase InsO family protein
MKAYPVTVLCKVMKVSRSGFYDYKNRVTSHKIDPEELVLESEMKDLFIKHKKQYGSRRLMKELQKQGYQIGRYRVRSLMKKLGLKVEKRNRFQVTTDSKHCHPVADNLLDRKFNVKEPDRVWTVDIIYIWTLTGWLYLAVVMDLYSRQIVGWAMDKHMKVELTLDALTMAYFRRKPPASLVHHSDRGSQYACPRYQDRLRQYKMIPSMSRKGNCWDNSPMERFFRSLKSERISYYRFKNRQEAKAEILDYISYYNTDRLHSYLGYMSPMDYKKERLLNVA